MRHSAHIGINVSARARRAVTRSVRHAGHDSHQASAPHSAIWHLFWTAVLIYFVLDLLVLPA